MKYPKNLEYVKASQDASDNLDMSTEATNAELNEAITDEFGVKYSKDGRKLLKAPKELKDTYSVKKGTEIICAGSFIYCESLRSLVLPAGVTTICNSAFWCCSSLSSLVIPDSVTCIGESAFMSCTSLFSLVIPDSITNIGDSVFWGSNLPNDLKQELISRFGEKIFR